MTFFATNPYLDLAEVRKSSTFSWKFFRINWPPVTIFRNYDKITPSMLTSRRKATTTYRKLSNILQSSGKFTYFLQHNHINGKLCKNWVWSDETICKSFDVEKCCKMSNSVSTFKHRRRYGPDRAFKSVLKWGTGVVRVMTAADRTSGFSRSSPRIQVPRAASGELRGRLHPWASFLPQHKREARSSDRNLRPISYHFVLAA